MSLSVYRLCFGKESYANVELTMRSTDGRVCIRCYLVSFVMSEPPPCFLFLEDAGQVSPGPNQTECRFFVAAFGKYTSSALFPLSETHWHINVLLCCLQHVASAET